MYFKVFFLVSLAISMAAAAPVVDGDDSGDMTQKRFLDAVESGKVQTKRLPQFRYQPYFHRQWPYQEMAEEEDYMDSTGRSLNKAQEQDDIAEMEGLFKKLRKLYNKGRKIYKIYRRGRNLYNQIRGLRNPRIAQEESLLGSLNKAQEQDDIAEMEGWFKKLHKLFKKGRKIYKIYRRGRNLYKQIRNPRIAQEENLLDSYRAIPTDMAEKEDLLKNVGRLVDIYNTFNNGVQKEDETSHAQVTASGEDGDEMAEEELSIPALVRGGYHAYKLYNDLQRHG